MHHGSSNEKVERIRRRARRLAASHTIPLHVALEIIESDKPVRETVRAYRAELESQVPHSTTPGKSVVSSVALVAAALFAMTAIVTWQMRPQRDAAPVRGVAEAAGPPAATRVVSTDHRSATRQTTRKMARVRTDDAGRILQVVGPTPESVLVAFCTRGDSHGREPVELAATIPARANARLGIFRDRSDLSEMYAIRIRSDRARGVWAAGSERLPVTPFVVRPSQIGSPRRPVR